MCTLNLCHRKPDTQQKDSVQSEHPVLRKRQKKWFDISYLSVEWNISIFRNILGVFSALDAQIKLIPFAVYQAPWDTSLEYPHGLVWNIMEIHFFNNWPSWETLKTNFWEKKKILLIIKGQFMRELNTDAYFAAMKQPKRAILDCQKSVHDGVKYPCKLCRYQATTKGNQEHQKTVNDGFKYPCKHCSYQATKTGSLKEHQKSVHEGVKYTCKHCQLQL